MISHSEEYYVRLQKMQKIQELGQNPFTPKARTPRDAYSKDLLGRFKTAEDNVSGTVYGRIILKRDFGKAAFATLRDEEGELQVYFKKDKLGDKLFDLYKLSDIGDIISVTGKMFFTQKGEPTLEASDFEILTKALKPLPEKFHGLSDVETRYRKRYLDMITNPEVLEKFVIRSKALQVMRDYLHGLGFVEVETPMLHPVLGGAAAKPFTTHHNALDSEFYLRIAPELYLKRLVAGGMHKVFEINRNFRNEGIDSTHNPEFTSMELYDAYSDCRGMIELFKGVLKEILMQLFGSTELEYQGVKVDFGAWKEISYSDCLRQKGVDPDKLPTREDALKEAQKHGLEIKDNMDRWTILAEIFDHLVADYITEPTIVFDYPASISPLSKRSPSNPDIAERFEAYAFGMEFCNGFSELNDPTVQQKVFEEQMKLKAGGDEEAMEYDEDYISALEQGMPPAGGIGIGVDRLIMVLVNTATIRDVILFPTMKRQ